MLSRVAPSELFNPDLPEISLMVSPIKDYGVQVQKAICHCKVPKINALSGMAVAGFSYGLETMAAI